MVVVSYDLGRRLMVVVSYDLSLVRISLQRKKHQPIYKPCLFAHMYTKFHSQRVGLTQVWFYLENYVWLNSTVM